MKQVYTIAVLVATRDTQQGDMLVNRLRRAGFALKPRWVHDRESLAGSLRERRWDLLLIGTDLEDLQPKGVMDLVTHSGRDIPVIVVCDGDPDGKKSVMEALTSGARDVVNGHSPHRLEHSVRRELSSLDHRRAARRLTGILKNSANSVKEFCDTTGDAVAFVQRGTVVYANWPFAALFGLPGVDSCIGSPLVKRVAEADRASLSSVLEERSDTEGRPVVVELQGCHMDSRLVDMHLHIAPAYFDGRNVSRVLIRASEHPDLLGHVHDTGLSRETVSGLHDRRYLIDCLDQRLKSTRAADFSDMLVYVKILNLHNLRAQMGFAGLETLTRAIERRLLAGVSPSGIPATVSDSAFAVLLPETSLTEAEAIARGIRFSLEAEPYEIGDQSILVSCIASVTTVAPQDENGPHVLDRAHAYNQLPMDEELDTAPLSDADANGLIGNLREAMNDGRLWLVYQPIVRLQGEPIELYSFGLLEKLPVDYLKLDASLVNDTAKDRDLREKVTIMVRRAHKLDEHTIASYVDDSTNLPWLHAAGVDFAQGYFVQAPEEEMEIEFSIELESMLDDQHFD